MDTVLILSMGTIVAFLVRDSVMRSKETFVVEDSQITLGRLGNDSFAVLSYYNIIFDKRCAHYMCTCSLQERVEKFGICSHSYVYLFINQTF